MPVSIRDRMADAIRFLSLDAIERATDGHPGAPLGCAEIITALFTRHMKFDPQNPLWPDRDRFVLSNGHGSMLLYSALHLSGYEGISIDEIRNFRVLGSHTHGHPERAPELGIEVTTGPLGQGIANAVGMAVAEARLAAFIGPDIVDHRTFALVGDGCLMEGVGQEVISLAGHLRLGKLCFLWDDNRITDDGSTDLSISEDVRGRFRIAGWQVIDVDGHDIDAVTEALKAADADEHPSMIACTTVIGRGLPRLEGRRGAHGGRVYSADLVEAREAAGWTHGLFEVPSDVYKAWTDGASVRNRPNVAAWEAAVAALPANRRAEFERLMRGDLPDGWREMLTAHRKRLAEEATTRSSNEATAEIVNLLAETIPELLPGAPDLEGPTNCKGKLVAFTAEEPTGRYLHYGIREHAMGSMMNGIVAHGGVLPLGATYLVFSDYMRPALRMAALMDLPVVTIYSHDSIGIGRNGPTHQPVEYLASLRAMPNMAVFRPADAVETAECWELALDRRGGPSSMICSRQPLQALRCDGGTQNKSAAGAYVLAEAEGGPRTVTLLATGSEVALAVAARDRLQADGVATAVVSMPCWELFEAQSVAYRNAVLGPGTIRVGVEAAVRQGWDRWIGPNGGFVGMTGFGASGASDDLYRHFGITVGAIVEQAKSRIEKNFEQISLAQF
ncbi:Transketolase 1 (plasmid) [Hartmannibacter diazotrophicus]|uniref:Transketolase n=1 Tax=Hartmannibacter diazotrophicus TaxID=1482074 RepID=A0A2C9DE64_9HYPH|nr:transketolase [Hartmannibacter diazotrophicus]SON58458.1 Transketolase 1 [Hartmannibacter diazotrophicus]